MYEDADNGIFKLMNGMTVMCLEMILNKLTPIDKNYLDYARKYF
jgi:hypothetical protein